ncbi:hypothetical protein RN001_001745 [Aquatica leii]|uniref:Circadian clock-controlled protein-like n=1 Tax=Aquatica leii TaxID=1421715 RepID=A0AAN7PGA1_9COLE|nr:hypothetical protein RN001_001745 [Aquatica leii]
MSDNENEMDFTPPVASFKSSKYVVSIQLRKYYFNVLRFCLFLTIASYINPCKVNDESCLKTSIQNTILKLKDGDKDLEIFPLKRVKLSDLKVEMSSSMPKQSMTNVFMDGLSENIFIDSVKINLTSCKMQLHLQAPHIKFSYDVTIKGKYHSTDVDITDKVVETTTTTHLPVYMNCKITEKGGIKYINITSVAVDLSIENITLQFSNKDNEVYKSIILEETRFYSLTDSAWNDIIKSIANKIFNSIPVNELFQE